MCVITDEEKDKLTKSIKEGMHHTTTYTISFPMEDKAVLDMNIWCNDSPYKELNKGLAHIVMKKEEDKWVVEINNQIKSWNREPIYHTYKEEVESETVYDYMKELSHKLYAIESDVSEFEIEYAKGFYDESLDVLEKMVKRLKPWHKCHNSDERYFYYFELKKDKWLIRRTTYEPDKVEILHNLDNVISGYPKEICGMNPSILDSNTRQRLFDIFMKIKK